MKPERFYKKHRIVDNPNLSKTFILADSADFKKPSIISLERVGKILQLKVENIWESKFNNVVAVNFSDQFQNPKLLPNTCSISPQTHIAVDENYLYVWIPQVSRWKRILLSEWPLKSPK